MKLRAPLALAALSVLTLAVGSCASRGPIRPEEGFPPTPEEGPDPWAGLRPEESRKPETPDAQSVPVKPLEPADRVEPVAESTEAAEPDPVPDESLRLEELVRGVVEARGGDPGEAASPQGESMVGETRVAGETTGDGPVGTSEVQPAEEAAGAIVEESPAPEEGPSPLTDDEIRERVADYLERLTGDEAEAAAAYRELWEVRAEVIPALIQETTSKRGTSLRELAILVLDTKRFVRVDEERQMLVYTIPGLGDYRYEELAAGKALSGKAAKAILRDREGFPVGVVIRAAMVNRFRSLDYPSGSDQLDIVGWWRRYYERRKPKL